MQVRPIDLVRDRLSDVTGYRPPNDKADWRCPAHDDGTASLSVTEGHDGRVLLNCHAGCDFEVVLGALSLVKADLFERVAETNGNGKAGLGDEVGHYVYTDAAGEPLFEVVRFAPKTFRQRHRDPQTGEVVWNLKDTQRVLYRLPRVLAAASEGGRVYVVEGEKDVESLEGHGCVATCNPGGAGKWRDDYNAALAGAEVIVVSDRDEPGRDHARKVAAALGGVAASVRVLEPAAGKDVTDHLIAGRSVADLVEWSDVEVPGAATGEGAHAEGRPFVEVNVGAMMQAGIPEPLMLTPWLYARALISLNSEPGFGKTLVMLWLALQVMQLGCDVVYMDEENGPEVIGERLAALGADPTLVSERFHYFPFESRSWSKPDLAAFAAMLAQFDPALVVVDSLADFLVEADKDEDKAKDVTKFIRSILGPVRDQGGTLILLDHVIKAAEQADSGGRKKRSRYGRGSGSKLGKVDAAFLLDVTKPFDVFTSGQIVLWKTKDRRGRVALPDIRKGEAGQLIDVNVGPGTLAFSPVDAPAEAGEWDGPTHCMEAVAHLLGQNPDEELAPRAVALRLRATGNSYRDQTIREALERLVVDGRATVRQGSNRARLYRMSDDVKSTEEEMF